MEPEPRYPRRAWIRFDDEDAKPAAQPGASRHQQHCFLLLAILAKRNHTRVARSPSGVSNI
jgi:hypothetical protein